jgi:hypothetical protein
MYYVIFSKLYSPWVKQSPELEKYKNIVVTSALMSVLPSLIVYFCIQYIMKSSFSSNKIEYVIGLIILTMTAINSFILYKSNVIDDFIKRYRQYNETRKITLIILLSAATLTTVVVLSMGRVEKG